MASIDELYVALSDKGLITYVGSKVDNEWKVWIITDQDNATKFMNQIRAIEDYLEIGMLERLRNRQCIIKSSSFFEKLISQMELSDNGFYYGREIPKNTNKGECKHDSFAKSYLSEVKKEHKAEANKGQSFAKHSFRRYDTIEFDEYDKVLVLESKTVDGKEYLLVQGIEGEDVNTVTPLVKFMQVFRDNNELTLSTITDDTTINTLKTHFRHRKVKYLTDLKRLNYEISRLIGWIDPLAKWQTKQDVEGYAPLDLHGIYVGYFDEYHTSVMLRIGCYADAFQSMMDFYDEGLYIDHYSDDYLEFCKDLKPYVDMYGIIDDGITCLIGSPGYPMNKSINTDLFITELKKEIKKKYPKCENISVYHPK